MSMVGLWTRVVAACRGTHILSFSVIVPSKSVKKMNFGFVFIAGRSVDAMVPRLVLFGRRSREWDVCTAVLLNSWEILVVWYLLCIDLNGFNKFPMTRKCEPRL